MPYGLVLNFRMRTTRQALAGPWWLLPVGRLNPLWWYGIGAAFIGFEYLNGPDAQFPVLYLIPVVLAAWYSGLRPAMAIAIAVPIAHIVFRLSIWPQESDPWLPIAATVFRAGVIVLLGLWFARLAEHERDLHGYVMRLEGLLPICSFCKSIRNKSGDWESLERFISQRSEAQFSHGLCPTCGKTHYPEFDLDDANRDRVEVNH
jgi:hypothetical protein